MRSLLFSSIVAFSTFAISTVAHSEDDLWTDDMEAALKQAADEDKDLIMNFTGSDWCVWCIKLEKEVFGEEEFKKKIVDDFVLVKLDFPNDKTKVSAETKQQNAAWKAKFSVAGFPSIFLVDSAGRPYAKTGYQKGGPGNYLKHVADLHAVRVKRDEFFAQAKEATGEEKARLLDQGLAMLDESFATTFYADTIKQIVELDNQDELGLRTKYYAAQDAEARKRILAQIAMAARVQTPTDALVTIDKAMAEMKLPPQMKIDAMRTKLRLLKDLKKNDQAKELLDEMIAIEGVAAEVTHRFIVQKTYFLVGVGKMDSALTMLDDRIAATIENLELYQVKGELLGRLGRNEEAIETIDVALQASDVDQEVLAELISTKADLLAGLEKNNEAVILIDDFVQDEHVSDYLKIDVLLQKVSYLLEQGRETAAKLAEEQAMEFAETPDEKREVQKMIEQLHRERS